MGKKIGLIFISFILLVYCGKKGPLVLEPELLPQKIEDFQLTQVGKTIKLQWEFPGTLKGKSKDKTKTGFYLERISKIHIHYSEKEILGGKFRKKSKLLMKLKHTDLTRVPEALRLRNVQGTKLPERKLRFGQTRKRENIAVSVHIPFKLKDLDKKQHFFAIQYYYKKKKSPISKVETVYTMIPVAPVKGLSVNHENKLIMLRWSRPQTDEQGNPVAIAGYHVFKKIDRETPTQVNTENPENTGSETPQESVFVRMNKDTVLEEYYEDTNTGENGTYSYYVSASMSSAVQSDKSQEVSVKVTDIYPPEIPANLVTFKAADHMFLTWREVTDSDLSHYRVYRRLPAEQEFTRIADNVTANQYKDTNARRGKAYYYAVTAVDKKGNESDYSNITRERF